MLFVLACWLFQSTCRLISPVVGALLRRFDPLYQLLQVLGMVVGGLLLFRGLPLLAAWWCCIAWMFTLSVLRDAMSERSRRLLGGPTAILQLIMSGFLLFLLRFSPFTTDHDSEKPFYLWTLGAVDFNVNVVQFVLERIGNLMWFSVRFIYNHYYHPDRAVSLFTAMESVKDELNDLLIQKWKQVCGIVVL
jgi:hypothetical protein